MFYMNDISERQITHSILFQLQMMRKRSVSKLLKFVGAVLLCVMIWLLFEPNIDRQTQSLSSDLDGYYLQMENDIKKLTLNKLKEDFNLKIPRENIMSLQNFNKRNLEQTKKTKVLCARFDIGRLGNQLFIFASAYGIARNNNMKLVLSASSKLIEIFPKIKSKIVKSERLACNSADWKLERKSSTFDKNMFEIKTKRNVYLQGYLQSWYYFRSVLEDLRDQFTFSSHIVHLSKTRLRHALNTALPNLVDKMNVQTVGVHVRRGDMLLEEGQNEGYAVASAEFFKKAMTYFRQRLANSVFIVIMSWTKTDDLDWAKAHITGSDVVFLGQNSLEVDLCAMTLCDHSIISVGTFGWWGAWLANGETVYCKEIAVKNSTIASQFSDDLHDYIPEGWIGM